jgi:pyruvate carboxylase
MPGVGIANLLLLQIGNEVGYDNAGTVEFLVDADTNDLYFIEVNPRIQVEHTVTEEVTGVDIVRSQILVAQGERLDGPAIALPAQNQIATHGFAIQCRVTTEDPSNNYRREEVDKVRARIAEAEEHIDLPPRRSQAA